MGELNRLSQRRTFRFLREALVNSLGRCFAAKHLARPPIEDGGNGGKCVGAMRAEVGALGEVLTKQPVGIFVGTTLPRALRIAEIAANLERIRGLAGIVPVDRDAGVVAPFIAFAA